MSTATDTAPALLQSLQGLLGRLYALDIEADVGDFLVTGQAQLRAADGQALSRGASETLLIEERDGELGLALYLDAGLLARLVASDPLLCLCGCNLQDFCTVVEGISHFNCVAWNAACDKSVTLLELELQAEIDKYLSARTLLGHQAGGDIGAGLLDRLFDNPAFDPALPPAQRSRYEAAHRLARQYCHSLQSRFPEGPPAAAMVRELRAFYRWAQPDKLSHICSAVLS